MKKLLSLTSVALLGVVALTGCSCGAKGTYTFDHIEYIVDGETKESTCENPSGLDEKAACTTAVFAKEVTLILEGNKFITKMGDSQAAEIYYKIEDGKILVSDTEDGEYKDSGFKYKFMGKIVLEEEEAEKGLRAIVFKK